MRYSALSLFHECGLRDIHSPDAALNGIMTLRYDRDIDTSLFRWFHGTPDQFRMLQRQMDVPYSSLSLEDRTDVAILLQGDSAEFDLQNPELFRIALGPGPILPESINHKYKSGKTLLHAVANYLGRAMCPSSRFQATFSRKSSRLK
jgi:hypothetical protein